MRQQSAPPGPPQGGQMPPPGPPRPQGPASPGTVEAIARDLEGDTGEDTMKNLRKTFAGIFGDM